MMSNNPQELEWRAAQIRPGSSLIMSSDLKCCVIICSLHQLMLPCETSADNVIMPPLLFKAKVEVQDLNGVFAQWKKKKRSIPGSTELEIDMKCIFLSA